LILPKIDVTKERREKSASIFWKTDVEVTSLTSVFFNKKTNVVRSFNHCLALKTLKFNNFETSHFHHPHSNTLALWFATSHDTVTLSPLTLQPLTTLQYHCRPQSRHVATSLSLLWFCNCRSQKVRFLLLSSCFCTLFSFSHCYLKSLFLSQSHRTHIISFLFILRDSLTGHNIKEVKPRKSFIYVYIYIYIYSVYNVFNEMYMCMCGWQFVCVAGLWSNWFCILIPRPWTS